MVHVIVITYVSIGGLFLDDWRLNASLGAAKLEETNDGLRIILSPFFYDSSKIIHAVPQQEKKRREKFLLLYDLSSLH